MPRTSYETKKASDKRQFGQGLPKSKSFRKRNSDAPTWDQCNPLRVAALVSLATTYGASPTFGYTRDGTSLVLGMWYKGERMTDYLSGPDDFEAYFAWLTDELLEVTDEDMRPYAMIETKKA